MFIIEYTLSILSVVSPLTNVTCKKGSWTHFIVFLITSSDLSSSSPFDWKIFFFGYVHKPFDGLFLIYFRSSVPFPYRCWKVFQFRSSLTIPVPTSRDTHTWTLAETSYSCNKEVKEVVTGVSIVVNFHHLSLSSLHSSGLFTDSPSVVREDVSKTEKILLLSS